MVKIYKKRKYWVEKRGKKFVVCDNDGCSEELYHVGDEYDSLPMAKKMVDFWAGGGHWQDRPDRK